MPSYELETYARENWKCEAFISCIARDTTYTFMLLAELIQSAAFWGSL